MERKSLFNILVPPGLFCVIILYSQQPRDTQMAFDILGNWGSED